MNLDINLAPLSVSGTTLGTAEYRGKEAPVGGIGAVGEFSVINLVPKTGNWYKAETIR